MSNNQQQLIKKYFDSLVREFIKDLDNHDINIVFKSKIFNGGESFIGLVEQKGTEEDGKCKYKYTISFLNHYIYRGWLRETVVHEFAHLYLFYVSPGKKHGHDDNFYSHMERFENWLDKKWDLNPREYGSDYGTDLKEYPNFQKRKEQQDNYARLRDLTINSENLEELEKNYQVAKNSSLYSENKKHRQMLDKYYQEKKEECERWEQEEIRRKKMFQDNLNKSNNVSFGVIMTWIFVFVIVVIIVVKIAEITSIKEGKNKSSK